MVAAKKVFLFETFEKCFCDFLKSSLKPIGCTGSPMLVDPQPSKQHPGFYQTVF